MENDATIALHCGEPGYPEALARMYDPPAPLYVRGTVAACGQPSISVVGSRKMTAYGERVLRLLVPPLVQAGLAVVSGLAYGIDSKAQRIALDCGGTCVAVLGNGLDAPYPLQNRDLFDRILASCGCALSEYPDGTGPQPYHFPARNRIVASLSPVTLIVEAGERSGTLITARCALEAGREVAVVPGDITRSTSAGVNSLLKAGAVPVTGPDDILELYRLHLPLWERRPAAPALTGSQATLYDLISYEPASVDSLAAHSGLPVQDVLAAVTELELAGRITSNGAKWHQIS